MKLLVVLAVLSATFAVGFTQSDNGTCTREQQTTFFTQQLSLPCALSFAKVDPTDSSGLNMLLPDIPSRSEPLNTVCTAECGSALSQFLGTCCEDEVGAAALFSWCTPTGIDNPGQDRCYFALPPVFNTSNFEGLDACDGANTTNPCPTGCTEALRGIITVLGCCFQSFYNNSEFVGGLTAVGLITPQEYADLVALGNPLLWGACQVEVPDDCTGNPFPATTTAAPIDIPSTCPQSAETTMAAAVNVVPFFSLMLVLLATTLVFVN